MTAIAAPTDTDLPTGFRIRLRGDLVRADGGRVLLGGSPVRAVRLGARAQRLLSGGEVTVEDPATARLARRLLDGNLATPVLDGIVAAGDDLTVVVPVRDRAVELARCLAALAPLRVVVVDDGSDDPRRVAEVVHAAGGRLVALPTNVGPAAARNAGLQQVETPLVAFVDSDVTVDAAALLSLARHCGDPLVALVGPQVVGRVRSTSPSWFERYDAAASSLDLGRTGGVVSPGAAVGWLPSACLVGRAAHLRAVGGFEDGWRVAEDVDLVWRLNGDGYVVRYDPDITAHHDVRTSAHAWLGRKFFYGTGGADLAARHGDKVAPAVLSPVMAVGAAALLQRRWWSLPVAGAATAITARALASRLPGEERPTATAMRLALRGLGWAARQESALLLRHWWPAAAATAPFSRGVRRSLTTAVAIDLVLFLRERPSIDPVTAVVGRRLDDLAYGSGLWWGAVTRRSWRCLKIRRR